MAARNAGSSGAARGTIQTFVGRMGFLASGYIITVILARGMGPADYGIYGLLISLLLWLEGFIGLGIPQATVIKMSGAREPEHVAQAARIVLCSTAAIVFAICWFLSPWAADFFRVENGTLLFRIAVADLPFFGLFLAYQGTLQGYARFGAAALSQIVYALTKLVGTLSLLVIGFSVEAALIVNVLTTVVALVYLVGRYPPRLFVPARPLFRRLLAVALPVGVFDFTLQLIVSAHLWLLKRIGETPDVVIGHYAAALNIARMPTIVATVLSGILLSSIARAVAANDRALALRYVQSASRFVFVVLVPVCVFGALQAEEIMRLLYADAYAGTGTLLVPLLLGGGMLALLLTLLTCIIAAGRQRLAAAVLAALLPLLLALGVLLTPAMGPAGAALSFLATTTCGALVALVLVHRYFGAPARLSMVLRVAGATAVVGLAGAYLHFPGWRVIVVLGGLQCAYWLALVLFKELGVNDLRPFAGWKTG